MHTTGIPIVGLLLISGLILGALALLGMILANKQTRLLGVVLVGLGSVPVILTGGYFLSMARTAEVSQSHTFIHEGGGLHSPAGPTFSPNWLMLILLMVMVVGVVAGLTHVARKQNVGWAPIATALAAVTCGGLLFVRLGTPVQMRTEQSHVVASTSDADTAFQKLTKPRIQLSTENTQTRVAGNKAEITASPEAAWAEVADAVENADAEKVTVKIAEKPERELSPPDWVTNPPKQIGGTFRTVLESGPYSTDEECIKNRQHELLRVAHDYLRQNAGNAPRDFFDIHHPIYFGTTDSELRKRFLRDEYWNKSDGTFAEMRTLYSLVEIDTADGQWLIDSWRRRQSEGKVETAIVGGGGILSVLAVAFGLLKLDEATKGYYTKRLLLGVPAVIIGLLTLVAQFV